MAAKKAVTKKKKKTATRKKAVRKAPRKKSAAKKPAARKGTSAKKTARKKVTRKKAAKKTARKATKKTTRKKATKKSVAKGKAGRKKAASVRKTKVKKGTVAKKTSSKKKLAAKKAAGSRKAASTRKRAPARKTPPRARSSASRQSSVLTGPVRGFEPYKPKRGEPYMSDAQLEHFRKLLEAWKTELMQEVDRTMLHMKDDAANFPDPNDRATQESEFGLELRTRDRERKLLKKIDAALQRVDDQTYGYCEVTGEEIGLRRLEARPVATLCVEAQERRERAEKQYRDREDYYR